MAFSFELMQDAGLAKPKARPEGENCHIVPTNSLNKQEHDWGKFNANVEAPTTKFCFVFRHRELGPEVDPSCPVQPVHQVQGPRLNCMAFLRNRPNEWVENYVSCVMQHLSCTQLLFLFIVVARPAIFQTC